MNVLENNMVYETATFIIDASSHYFEHDPRERSQCVLWLNGDMATYELALRIYVVWQSIGEEPALVQLSHILQELFPVHREQIELCTRFIRSIARLFTIYLTPLLNQQAVHPWEVRLASMEELVIDEWSYGSFRLRLNYPSR